MIKCGVCGSENEAAALFCGTCGSPLTPAEAEVIADEAVEPTVPEGATGDEAVVPGKGGARRDLGVGGGTTAVPPPPDSGTQTEVIADQETLSGGPTIVCSVCGTVNDASRTYCRKCANELKPAPPPPPPPPPPPTRGGISPLAIGLGAAAVVVAIALVGVLVFGGPGASPIPSGVASTGPSGEPTSEASAGPTATARTFTEGEPTGQIAFARCPPNGDACTIYIRVADGSANARRLTSPDDGSAFDPSLSHDGTRILYSVVGLRILDIESGDSVRHSNVADDSDGTWSSDDSQIVYAGHRDRDPGDDDDDFEIRLDTVNEAQDSIPLTANDILDYDPDFLPDDSGVVFAQGDDDASELMLLDIASGEITRLTTDEFGDEDPAVSPDGTEVVFASTRGGTGGYDLFLLNLQTLEITALPSIEGDEHDPAWSPGGRYIVFSGGVEGRENLSILDLADGSIETYTSTAAADLTPSWR